MVNDEWYGQTSLSLGFKRSRLRSIYDQKGLMESSFGLDPVLDFCVPSSWRMKGTDGKFFDIGVDVYEDSTLTSCMT